MKAMPLEPSHAPLANGRSHLNNRSPTETDHAVGKQIRALRRAAGMTLKDLGEAVGVSLVQFQRYETGASRVAASRLFAIGDALGVRVENLIAGPGLDDTPSAPRRRQNECAELMRAFNAISDPGRRIALIALTVAARDEPPIATVPDNKE